MQRKFLLFFDFFAFALFWQFHHVLKFFEDTVSSVKVERAACPFGTPANHENKLAACSTRLKVKNQIATAEKMC